MAISITGGVNLGTTNGGPYTNLNAQIGTAPNVQYSVGPSSALSLNIGGASNPVIPGGDVINAVLPPVLAPIVNGGLVDAIGHATPLAPVISNDPVVINQLHLGGTELHVPIAVTNSVLFN